MITRRQRLALDPTRYRVQDGQRYVVDDTGAVYSLSELATYCHLYRRPLQRFQRGHRRTFLRIRDAMHQNLRTKEQKLASFEAHLKRMDELGVDEIEFGSPPFVSTINRREVLNTLAALRGEATIDWAKPKIEERERVGKKDGEGVFWNKRDRLWVVQVQKDGEKHFGGYHQTRTKAELAARRLRVQVGACKPDKTHCSRGHLWTLQNILFVAERGKMRGVCRTCRTQDTRNMRQRKRDQALADRILEQMKEAA